MLRRIGQRFVPPVWPVPSVSFASSAPFWYFPGIPFMAAVGMIAGAVINLSNDFLDHARLPSIENIKKQSPAKTTLRNAKQHCIF
jgi:hypothetical protein